MSQASSSYGVRVRRVMCPNCHVLANRFISTTEKNPNRVFHKCPYFAYGGCQYYQWEDEMDQVAAPFYGGPLQAVAAPGPLHAVPLQAVPPLAAPIGFIHDGSQVAAIGGNEQGENRVMQQLR